MFRFMLNTFIDWWLFVWMTWPVLRTLNRALLIRIGGRAYFMIVLQYHWTKVLHARLSALFRVPPERQGYRCARHTDYCRNLIVGACLVFFRQSAGSLKWLAFAVVVALKTTSAYDPPGIALCERRFDRIKQQTLVARLVQKCNGT